MTSGSTGVQILRGRLEPARDFEFEADEEEMIRQTEIADRKFLEREEKRRTHEEKNKRRGGDGQGQQQQQQVQSQSQSSTLSPDQVTQPKGRKRDKCIVL